jgi:hypothetical protein
VGQKWAFFCIKTGCFLGFWSNLVKNGQEMGSFLQVVFFCKSVLIGVLKAKGV